MRNYLDEIIKFTKVFFFNDAGEYAGEATTNGLGDFVSTAGLPNGTYYAATSRAARPEDSPDEAIDAEDGAAEGLLDQIWNGVSCDRQLRW